MGMFKLALKRAMTGIKMMVINVEMIARWVTSNTFCTRTEVGGFIECRRKGE